LQTSDIQNTLEALTDVRSKLLDLKGALCPHMCSGKGNCLGEECVCDENYEGMDCSVATTNVMSNVRSAGTFASPAASGTNGTTLSPIRSMGPTTCFDFGRSSHTFIASYPIPEQACRTLTQTHTAVEPSFVTPDAETNQAMSQISVALWLQPRGGGGDSEGSTVLSYATNDRMSEILLWIDSQCGAGWLWINSVKRGNAEGIPIANFSQRALCDGKWHHLAFTWDGSVGHTVTYLDGLFWEMHWNVYMGETVDFGGRIVLGHNQVHMEERTQPIVPDAYLGVMSDFFFFPNTTLSSADYSRVFETSGFNTTAIPYLHWRLSAQGSANGTQLAPPSPSNEILDVGNMNVNAVPFGGNWVETGNRVCDSASPAR